MPYRSPVVRVTRTPTTPDKGPTISCSCTGCLLSIISLIGILWIAFHLTEITQFITG